MRGIRRFVMLGVALGFCSVHGLQAEEYNRLGVGAHYWKAVKNIDVNDIDESGMSYLATYQLVPAWFLKLEADLEVFPDGFAGNKDTTYAPQAFALLGSWIYGGLGIGVTYADGEFAENPFYTVRAGLDLPLPLNLHLDINANYQFLTWEKIKELQKNVHSDAVTAGAAVRLAF